MSNLVAGRRAVFELLALENIGIERLIVAYGAKGEAIQNLIHLAKSRGIAIEDSSRVRLDKISNGLKHQGVVAVVSPQKYSSLDKIVVASKSRVDPIVVILDQIQDPQNLGAIIRVAESVNACGAVIPNRRSTGLTPAVMRSSAGAAVYVPVAEVSNIAYAIEELKAHRFWIVGAEPGSSTPYYQVDLRGPLGLVIGNENSGIRRLVKEKCDLLVKIPMSGNVKSLNASVSAGIILYEAMRQRETEKREKVEV